MHLCSLVFEKLRKKIPGKKGYDAKKFDEFENKIRVAGALHDIGQGPYSHLAERITGGDHEEVTCDFIEHDEHINKVLEKDFKFDEIDIKQIIQLIKGEKKNFDEYEFLTLSEILNSPLDVDKLDYLQRDSYYTGVGFGTIEFLMLLNNLDVESGSIVIEDGGIYAAEMLMVSRLEMYQAVYMSEHIRARETAVVEAFRIIKKELINDENKLYNYNYYKVNIPETVPPEFVFSDTALKMLIRDAKDISESSCIAGKISCYEKQLIDYCYNALWDQPVPKEWEFEMVFEGKIEEIKDAILRRKLLRLKNIDEKDGNAGTAFEEAVKKELEGIIALPRELILVDRTKFLPYGLSNYKLGEEPIIKLSAKHTRNISRISNICEALKNIPAEPLRIFIPNKYYKENKTDINLVIQDKLGDFVKSEENSLNLT